MEETKTFFDKEKSVTNLCEYLNDAILLKDYES